MEKVRKYGGPANHFCRSIVPLFSTCCAVRRLLRPVTSRRAGALPYEDQGRNAMKKRLTALALAVPLCLGGLALVLTARSDDTPPSPAGPPPKVAPSHVTHVTVYPNSALVTREVEVGAG